MKKGLIASVAVLSLSLAATAGFCDAPKGGKLDGKKEFEKHCAACHPNGGNVVNPQKGLGAKQLKANGVKTAQDIIGKMRNPGPGMTKFDTKTLPDKEARAIADYIIKTYK